jgi:hypothetical protein
MKNAHVGRPGLELAAAIDPDPSVDAACRAGGSIIHPHNLYVRYFANLLGLVVKAGDDDD